MAKERVVFLEIMVIFLWYHLLIIAILFGAVYSKPFNRVPMDSVELHLLGKQKGSSW